MQTDPQKLIGYARISKANDQDPQAQIDALTEAGCHRIFTDHISGTHEKRPQLTAALDYLRKGDVLVVWRLDRLGRSLPHLLHLVESLNRRQIEFRSLTEAGMNTTDPGGKLLFTMAAAFAEFERDIISERTKLGVRAAQAAGRPVGRPIKLDAERRTQIHKLRRHGETISALARGHNVSRATIRRVLQEEADGDKSPAV